MPILPGLAGTVDLTLEEGGVWPPVFRLLPDDPEDDTPVPFATGTTAYLTVRDRVGGNLLVRLGPVGDDLDGTVIIDEEGGVITCRLAPSASVGLPLPVDMPGGAWDLFILPAGDPEQAYPLLRGRIIYRRRVTEGFA